MAQMLVYFPDGAKGEAVREYAQYLRGLLGGQICYEPMVSKEGADRIRLAAANCDLIVFGEPEQSWLETLLSGWSCDQVIAQSSSSFLLARRPRWPIKSILLILRIEKIDDAAVDWMSRLAQPCETTVTILPIVSSLPAVHSLGTGVQAELDILLSPNTLSGRHLRHIAEQRKQWQIEGDLHLRQLADKLDGNQVVVRQGTEEIVLNIPNNVVLELKAEEEDKKGKIKRTIEVEIEWIDGDDMSSGGLAKA